MPPLSARLCLVGGGFMFFVLCFGFFGFDVPFSFPRHLFLSISCGRSYACRSLHECLGGTNRGLFIFCCNTAHDRPLRIPPLVGGEGGVRG